MHFLMGKSKLSKLLGRPRRIRVDVIKCGLKEMGWEDVAWMHLAQGRKKWLPVVCLLVNYLDS
jgi:hypothetical protein